MVFCWKHEDQTNPNTTIIRVEDDWLQRQFPLVSLEETLHTLTMQQAHVQQYAQKKNCNRLHKCWSSGNCDGGSLKWAGRY